MYVLWGIVGESCTAIPCVPYVKSELMVKQKSDRQIKSKTGHQAGSGRPHESQHDKLVRLGNGYKFYKP